MKCPNCGHENREGAKFCIGCAQPLLAEVVCSQCGHTNPQGARFCEQCAHSLAEPAPPTIPSPLDTTSFEEKLDKIQRSLPGAKENLNRAIETYRECGAEGWLQKAEEALVEM